LLGMKGWEHMALDVSVVIPAYNAERWIGRAIDSVLNQTAKPAEIIVVDDGSTDGTPQAVQKYGAAIRYFHQPNAGPAAARNLGIDNTQFEWIGFLDADDEWLPRKLELQLHVLKENPGLRWCSCARDETDVRLAMDQSCPGNRGQDLMCPKRLVYLSALMAGVQFGTSSLLVHRSVFQELGGFDTEMRTGEDVDMWERIALKYPEVGHCCSVCWHYLHDNPNSASRRGAQLRDLQLRHLCANMRRALSLGPEITELMRPYARQKAVDYLTLEAGRQCWISPDTIEDARRLFPLTFRERSLLRILRALPKPIARKAVRRFTL